MKFLDAVGPIAISKSVWSQLLDENEKGRSVTSFQDVSLDGTLDALYVISGWSRAWILRWLGITPTER